MERNEIVEREKKILEKYAVLSYETKGRKYKEKEHSFRTPFQRDRDRIIHSTAFRRLEYKTQVFIYHEGDYYRNRLTHTLEVQQIARTIARVLKINEDLVEAISLAHDLGHTPFGHKGEVVLNEIMKSLGFSGFEHNRQGLRIVDILEERYPDFPGLNLTFEVREGIIRHFTSYDIPLIEKEYQEFAKFVSPTLEAQVVNIADEIAYTCHDLDDGIKSEIIDYKNLMEVDILEKIKEISEIDKKPEKHKRHIMIRNLINFLVSDVIEETKRNLNKLNPRSVEDVRNCETIVKNSEEVRIMHNKLKKFLEEKMYTHSKVIRMTEKAGRIIKELYYAYYNEPRQLPLHIHKKLEKEPKEIVICDYVAGMTDRFAIREYQKLFDPATF
ncbi:MAG: deoxyguanosinetriphosphate triphosphohydrolase [Candidatus Omnitrophica bacterium]|nr:deoxyguanosinetriphosphate triphosphohydrolase [Candidatus Omnitrophota bacterium]